MGNCLSALLTWCFFGTKQGAEVLPDGEEETAQSAPVNEESVPLLRGGAQAQKEDQRPNDTARRIALEYNGPRALESNHSRKGAARSVAPRQSPPLPDIYGIIIGINKYAQPLKELEYAVKDADDFQSFLESDLGVRKENFINLRDSTATREGILDAFSQLEDKLKRSKVEKDKTAIIIFYAGHGTTIEKPSTWSNWLTDSDTIEGIVPSDCGKDRKVPPIPDRTIGVLLSRLAKLVGDNITMIADCCHSASIARDTNQGPFSESLRIRSDECRRTIPDDCDANILDDASQHGLPYEFFESHVLLAACGQLESAYEGEKQNGQFTHDLLHALREAKRNSHLVYLTYKSLLGRMPHYADQNPHGVGPTNRLLFTSTTFGDAGFLVCLPDQALDSRQFSLQCGLLYGVAPGHEIDLYTSDELTASNRLCRCPIEYADNLTSKFRVPKGVQFSSGKPLYCKLVTRLRNFPRLSVSSNDPDWLFPLLDNASIPFRRSTAGDSRADLRFEVDGDVVHVHHRFSFTTEAEISGRLPDSIRKLDIITVQRVVQYVASFRYYLTLHPTTQLCEVEIELYKVDSPQLPTKFVGRNVLDSGKPVVVADNDKDAYGIRIRNRSSQGLYVYLFRFNPVDLSIREVYTAASPAVQGTSPSQLDPCLKPRGEPGSTIQIGLNNVSKRSRGNGKAWKFKRDANAKEDVIFLKLFTFPEPQDFMIAQDWSRLVSEGRGDMEEVEIKQPQEVWDAKCAKIILRRSNSEWQSSKEIVM